MSFWLCSFSTLLFYLTQRHSFRTIICTSCIYYFLFPIQPSFFPSHKHYYVSSAICPKQLTSLQQLGCPILFFSLQKWWISSYLFYHKMPSSSISPSSASITHPVSSSQHPVPPEPCLLISTIFS